MNDAEQTEYLGLAAAVGRLAAALKNTEAALAEATAERDALAERLAEIESGTSPRTAEGRARPVQSAG